MRGRRLEPPGGVFAEYVEECVGPRTKQMPVNPASQQMVWLGQAPNRGELIAYGIWCITRETGDPMARAHKLLAICSSNSCASLSYPESTVTMRPDARPMPQRAHNL